MVTANRANLNILGISGLYHNSAAALVVNGKVIRAAQEERFTRRKNDKSLPVNAIEYCLKDAGVRGSDLDAVVYYDNPLLTLDRHVKNFAWLNEADARAFIESSYESLFRDKLWVHELLAHILRQYGYTKSIHVCEHHASHAAYAFYESPFEEAAILTLDGVGEWSTTTLGIGVDNEITQLKQINYPDSIGLLYSAFTQYCGFKVNSGEYKLMGLASYGEPVYANLIRDNLIDVKDDGSFALNMDFFEFDKGQVMVGAAFEELFKRPIRLPDEENLESYANIASSIQAVTEEVVEKMAGHLRGISEKSNLCLCGGVALNCVSNGRLVRSGIFEMVFIPPAADDSGGSVGAALQAYYRMSGCKRHGTNDENLVYLGPSYSDNEIERFLKNQNESYQHVPNQKELIGYVADLLAEGEIIGFFQGRMEFGPRALGARSILANPLDETMQERLNRKIKFRESFRPFAPAVIAEKADDYFDLDVDSPYMLLTAPVKEAIRLQKTTGRSSSIYELVKEKRSTIPAVTHVDYSARIQTVRRDDNPMFYDLIKEFGKRTNCYMLVNTSFNVRGEPIVCSPQDAYRCYQMTEMDALVMGSFLLRKGSRGGQHVSS